jgi:hypothetical protein
MKESERRIREALHEASAPEENQAEERAWRVVQAAHAEQPPRRRSPGLRRRGLQLVLVLGLVAALISPAGAAVRHWVADTVSPGRKPAKPALTSLPAAGSLLVQSAAGPWVVHADGSKRLLGAYTDATWSPHGLFVAATTRHQLVTMDPRGEAHWTIAQPGRVSRPSWKAPDGFRLAYLSGTSLRVVVGDGSHDHLLEPRVAPVAPAWLPGPRYVLAFARPNGAIEVVQAGSDRRVFQTAPGERPRSLQWAPGDRLLVTRSRAAELRGPGGAILWRWTAPDRTRIVAARLAPEREQVALIVSSHTHSRLLLTGPGTQSRALFSGPGLFSGVEWSPDGHWLLLAWKSADQWLFLNPSRAGRIEAISQISAQFAPGAQRPSQAGFPQVRGWCCPR